MKRTRRYQTGHLFRHRRKWYVRYRDDVLRDDGTLERVQLCRPLGDAVGPHGLTRSQARRLMDEFLRPLNDGTYTPQSTMTLNRFVEQVFLPAMEREKELSTYRDYKNKWLRYIKPRGDIALRDFRTIEGEQVLRDISSSEDLSKTTLMHIKNFVSGVFRYAHRIGVLNGANPMREVRIPKARPAGQTHAHSLGEIVRMISLLPEPAATLVATAGLAGFSKGELRGALIENYTGDEIRVTQSVWRSSIKEPKTPYRKDSVPVITPLRTLLDQHVARCGRASGLMFADEIGRPLNLDALARDVIRPALAKAGLTWRGWHAFRRGLGTNLGKLRVPPKTIQRILRHASPGVTLKHYILPDSTEAQEAMQELEKMCATIVQPLSPNMPPRM